MDPAVGLQDIASSLNSLAPRLGHWRAAFLGPSICLCSCLVLNGLQLFNHDVHLRVTYGEDVAFHCSRACGVSFNSKLYSILCVDKVLALPCIVVSAIDRRSIKRPNLLPVKYLVRLVLGLPPLFGPKNRLALRHMSMPVMPLIVNPLWGTVDSDTYFGNVWIKVVFTVSSACCVGNNE